MSGAPEAVLETHDLSASYGDFQALFGIDVHVARGETVAIIGANGAGKSTFLRSVVGSSRPTPEQVTFEGKPIGHLPAHEIVRRGVALVPEGRMLFPSLSVEENLRLGAYGGRAGPWRIERVQELFPILRERRATPSTRLSGGEQQMCAIGRALMSNPTLLLCDELSLGLAPVIIRQIYAVLAGDRLGRHHRRRGRAGHQPGAFRGRPRLLLPGRPGLAPGQAGQPVPRGRGHRLFRSLTRWKRRACGSDSSDGADAANPNRRHARTCSGHPRGRVILGGTAGTEARRSHGWPGQARP